MTFFLIFGMVLSLLDQLQIFLESKSPVIVSKVVSYRIARAFNNRSGATQAVALDISNAFDRVWHAALLHKL